MTSALAIRGVYSLTNTLTGQCYVGSALNVARRLSAQRTRLRHGTSPCSKLQRAWLLHGEGAFTCTILEEVAAGVDLAAREAHWITALDSVHAGYNSHHMRASVPPARPRSRSSAPAALEPGDATWFWQRIAVGESDACWPWTGARTESGYGVFNRSGGRWRAHRFAYTLAHGPIAASQVIRHMCHNPPCCNPAHLCPGSMADNTRDMMSAGRGGHGPVRCGERHPRAKVTDALVRQMCERYLAGETHEAIALSLGLAVATVCGIVRGKEWAHLEWPDGLRARARAGRPRIFTPPANMSALRQRAARAFWGPRDDEGRFWAKVDKNGPVFGEHGACWLWTGAKTTAGYGSLRRSDRTLYAHRVAYEEVMGPLDVGHRLVHLCGLASCVNPTHLRAIATHGRRLEDKEQTPA